MFKGCYNFFNPLKSCKLREDNTVKLCVHYALMQSKQYFCKSPCHDIQPCQGELKLDWRWVHKGLRSRELEATTGPQ